MKTLKLTFAFSALFMVLLNFTACKKDKNGSPETVVTADDLLAYNITAILSDEAEGKKQLKLFYFNKDGNDVVATLDAITSRRGGKVQLVNNVFTFDVNADGNIIYTIALSKDKAGKLSVSSFDYVSKTNAAYKITSAITNATAGLPAIKNISFKTTDNITVKFNTDTWTISSTPNVTGSFYQISPGAWKGNFGGKDFMGVSIANGNQTNMVIQQDNALITSNAL